MVISYCMSSQAPHLPDELTPSYRRAFFVLLIFLSVLAGVAGGAMTVRLMVPDVLRDVVQSLPLSSQVRTSDMGNRVVSFSDMVSFAQTLTSSDGTGVGTGTAFTADGWIVTDADAIRRVTHVRVDNTLKRIDAFRTVIDDSSGVAFIKIDYDGFSTPRLASDPRFEAGDRVYVVSDELGVVEARVSVPYGRIDPPRGVYEAHEFYRVFVLDRRMPDVMVGAPVFDASGAFVGLVAFHPDYEHQALVIPVHHFTQTFKEVVTDGTVSHPYVGVRYVPARVSGVDLSLFVQGQRVEGSATLGISAVKFGSPAYKAGIREGDIILSIDGHPVGVRDTLPDVLMRYEPGQTITIRYARDGQEFDVRVELGSAS